MGLLGSKVVSRFDEAVDAAFGPLRQNPITDRAMYALTELGDFSLIWHTIAVGRAAFGSRRQEREMYRLSAALAVEATIVNGPLKLAFRRQRPVVAEERTHTLRQPKTSSFPSGHASAAACAVTVLIDGAGPAATAGWITLGALVAGSRVHVRIHHASDIVGGALVGIAAGSVMRRWWPLT